MTVFDTQGQVLLNVNKNEMNYVTIRMQKRIETDDKSGVNFINILRVYFTYKILAPKITKLCFGFEILAPKILYKKCVCKTLMKLTPEDETLDSSSLLETALKFGHKSTLAVLKHFSPNFGKFRN